MKRGDVVRVDLPPPKGARGHEQVGERPAVVIQSDESIPRVAKVVVVPLTSNQDALRFPGTFLVQPNPGNGLATPSVALTFQVRAIDKKRVRRVQGALNEPEMAELLETLRDLLAI